MVPVLPKFVSHSIEATPCHNATVSYSSAFVRFVFESVIQRSVMSKKAPVCPLLQPFFDWDNADEQCLMSLLCRETAILTALSRSSPHVALSKDRDAVSALPAFRSAILNCEDRCCCHEVDVAVSWSSEGA